MKQRLCLHGLEVKHQAQLLNLVKRLLPGASVKYKTKEKYFKDNDMYKCRVVRFTPVNTAGLRVQYTWGILLVSDKLMPVADITFEFETENVETVQTVEKLIGRCLASRIRFVLEEPSLSLRIDQLRGCFDQKDVAAYDEDSAASLLYCHLPWQLYYVNKLWAEVLQRGAERPLMRQLRVKLRRLRSTLTFCKPLLPAEEVTHWQALLKARTNLLGDVRECDVLLMTCAKLKDAQGEQAAEQLTEILQKQRTSAATKALKGQKLNKLTLELAKLLLWVYTVELAAHSEETLYEFLEQRFGSWYRKIIALPEKYPDVHNMEQMHRIRIKLKRFRYALQSIPEVSAEPKLLRSLKYLQDMLGLLHDNYINNKLIEAIVAKHPKIKELRYESAMFTGWEQAKADAALEILPQQWESFIALLDTWKEKNL